MPLRRTSSWTSASEAPAARAAVTSSARTARPLCCTRAAMRRSALSLPEIGAASTAQQHLGHRPGRLGPVLEQRQDPRKIVMHVNVWHYLSLGLKDSGSPSADIFSARVSMRTRVIGISIRTCPAERVKRCTCETSRGRRGRLAGG